MVTVLLIAETLLMIVWLALSILLIVAYCKAIHDLKSFEKEEEMRTNEKLLRCQGCKNCKQLYQDGYVVCEKMDFKTPLEIPDVCNKVDLKSRPMTVFDEFDDTSFYDDDPFGYPQ